MIHSLFERHHLLLRSWNMLSRDNLPFWYRSGLTKKKTTILRTCFCESLTVARLTILVTLWMWLFGNTIILPSGVRIPPRGNMPASTKFRATCPVSYPQTMFMQPASLSTKALLKMRSPPSIPSPRCKMYKPVATMFSWGMPSTCQTPSYGSSPSS